MKYLLLVVSFLFFSGVPNAYELRNNRNSKSERTHIYVNTVSTVESGQSMPDTAFVWQPETFLNLFTQLKKEDTLFVNFWATWCKPCVEEMPDLIAAIKKTGTPALFVSFDNPDKAQTARAWIQNQGWDARFILLDITDFDSFIKEIDPRWQGGIPMSILKYGKKHRSHYQKFGSGQEVIDFLTRT